MDARSVFVVGDSLVADALAQVLSRNGVTIAGAAASAEAALPLLRACPPDAVILANASADPNPPAAIGQLLAALPEVAILCVNVDAGSIQVIASHRVGAQSADLLAAIQSLRPRR